MCYTYRPLTVQPDAAASLYHSTARPWRILCCVTPTCSFNLWFVAFKAVYEILTFFKSGPGSLLLFDLEKLIKINLNTYWLNASLKVLFTTCLFSCNGFAKTDVMLHMIPVRTQQDPQPNKTPHNRKDFPQNPTRLSSQHEFQLPCFPLFFVILCVL